MPHNNNPIETLPTPVRPSMRPQGDRPKMRSFAGTLGFGLLTAALVGGPLAAAQAEALLNRGIGGEPDTLDIQKSAGSSGVHVQKDLFEGLLTLDARGGAIPGAAESWTVSDDGLTYVFKLRPDGKWSDGSPVTAADFVFSWQRLIDPKTGGDYAYFLDPIANAKDIRLGKKPLTDLGARAVDDHTLEVTLAARTPYFLSMLLYNPTYPISKANYEKFGDDFVKPGNMVSNGAFTLAEAVPQSHMKLVRNPNFHDAANIKLDTVMYYITEDQNSELQRFQAGELDVTYRIPAGQIRKLQETDPAEIRLAPRFTSSYYAYNLTHAPWKDSPELRQALSLAIDRDVITGKIMNGGETPAYTFVPPGTANFKAWAPDYAGQIQAQRDDMAKALFAKAGYGPDKPLSVEILYDTSELNKNVAVAIAAMWKQKLGVQAALTNVELKAYFSIVSKREFKDIAHGDWTGDYNDAYNFLELLLGDVGGMNMSGYANPAFDALMRQTATEADLDKRAGLLQDAERLMIGDAPIIPIAFSSSKHMVSTRVSGWENNVQDYHLSRWINVQR